MSWWFAPFYDQFMAQSEEACVAGWRRELLAEASGEVLDLGAGTGANVPFFGPRVEHVVAAEPDPAMAKQLREKLRARNESRIEVVETEAESLPFGDAAFDVVVSTLVLCTVRDPVAALSQVRRVLKPGGRLLFVEHVAAERPARRILQHVAEPAWKRLAGGCHLTRRTDETIAKAGFTIRELTRDSIRKALPVVRPSIRGVALRP
jgi:ubiquinone/menaquinone biosynthesis C-methylase UbiE